MADEGVARRRAGAVDDVEHPVGQTRLLGDLAEEGQAEWSELRWLDDDGVAGGERRTDLPGPEHQRGVPRHDQCGDTGRVESHGVRGLGAIDHRVLHRSRPVGEELDVPCGSRHAVPWATCEEGTVVVAVHHLEVGHPADDGVGEAVEDLTAALRPEGRPRREGRSGCCDRSVHLGGAGRRDVAEHTAVDRTEDLVGITGASADTTAADQVTARHADAADVDACRIVH